MAVVPMPVPTARTGTVLLLVLAIVTTLLVLAYGFVRTVQLQGTANDSANRALLARAAALDGTNHAIEQILRDYTTQPFTRFDSPSRAAFVAHDYPYYFGDPFTVDNSVANGWSGINRDDLPGENNLLQIIGKGDGEAMWYGMLTNELRGRFHELEFGNQPIRTAGYGAETRVVVPFRFEPQPLQSSGPLPDRFRAIFYDERLCRIDYDQANPASVWAARQKARYRLRYAVVTQDLEGTLLVNGDPAVDARRITGADPATLDADAARVVRNMHRLAPMVDAVSYFGMEGNRAPVFYGWTGGIRAEHVFAGRGATSNFDRVAGMHEAGYKNNAPVTFPLMYRLQNLAGKYAKVPAASTLAGTLEGYQPAGLFTTRQLASASANDVAGNPAGNETIALPASSAMLTHTLLGPQYSFENWSRALAGNGFDLFTRFGYAACLGRFAPFGRGMSKRDAAGGEAVSRFRGNVDTPWCVNLLTMTPSLAYGMIASYLPPGGMTTAYFPNDVAHKTDITRYYLAVGYVGANAYYAGFRNARDIFVDKLSPAFARYAAPARATPSVVSPDYHVSCMLPSDPGWRAPTDRYPGPLCVNGYDASATHVASTTDLVGKWRNDNLGYYLRSKASPYDYYYTSEGATLATGRPRMRNAALSGTSGTTYTADGSTHPTGPIWDQMSGARMPSMQNQNTTPSDWAAKTAYATGDVVKNSDGAPTPTVRIYRCFTGGTSADLGPGPQSSATDIADGSMTQDLDHDGVKDPQVHWTYVKDDDGAQWAAFTIPHPDSIWNIVVQTLAVTIAEVQGQQFQYKTASGTSGYRDPAKWFDGAAWSGPRASSIREVDAVFVANLGSDITKPNSPTVLKAWKAAGGGALKSFMPDYNLAGLRINPADPGDPSKPHPSKPQLLSWNDPLETGYDATQPSYTSEQRTAIIECIINDVRLSFFGASPYYGDSFRALDLNGDGKAHCSGFAANPLASASEIANHLDQYVDTASGRVDGNGVALVPVDTYFSNTGCFFIGKSRFWRITVRGELWDNVLKTAVNDAQLDTVICVDPADKANELGGIQDPAGGQYATHVISQAWWIDAYRALLPRHE